MLDATYWWQQMLVLYYVISDVKDASIASIGVVIKVVWMRLLW